MEKQRKKQAKLKDGKQLLIVSFGNKWRRRWSYLIIIVAIYSAFAIPMRIAIYPSFLDPIYTPVDIITYILYVADFIINLRTTYRDSHGEDIVDTGKIFWHYVASVGFWIDLLSLLNYPLGHNPILNCIGILKINRLLRIYKLINESNLEKGPKILLLIGFYYFLFVIYLHVVACLWFLMIEMTYMEA